MRGEPASERHHAVPGAAVRVVDRNDGLFVGLARACLVEAVLGLQVLLVSRRWAASCGGSLASGFVQLCF